MKTQREPRDPPFPQIDLKGYVHDLEMRLFGISPLRFERGHRPRDALWASQLGACPRAVFLGWHNPQPHDIEFDQHRGALGHAVEDLRAGQLARILVAREVTFRTELISGRADFVVRIDGKQLPLEMKSTYGLDLSVSSPKPSHVLQVQFYISQMPEAPYGILEYYNLANYGGKSGHYVDLVIPRDDTRVRSVAENLMQMIKSGIEPPCESPGDCWDCDRADGKL